MMLIMLTKYDEYDDPSNYLQEFKKYLYFTKEGEKAQTKPLERKQSFQTDADFTL